MSERRLRLTLGYRGTRYAGWAVQSPSRTRGRPTLQAAVETALGHSLGHPVRVTAAGRTDAGVHADGQVVSFETSSSMTNLGLRRVLAGWLPDDVWVVDVDNAPSSFDARRSVLRRWYRYAIWREGVPPGGWQGRCLRLEHGVLDVSAMRRAARVLLGRRNLAALATKPRPGQSTDRTVFAADWLELSRSLLMFEVCADAFLKQMVRTMVGSLLWVGSGRWSVERFSDAVASSDRREAGPTAPALGLSLHRIEY